MKVAFHPDVYKQLQQLPRKVFAAELAQIIALSHDAHPAGAIKLVGAKSDWRVRIGQYRVVYAIDDRESTVTVMSVMKRGDAYR